MNVNSRGHNLDTKIEWLFPGIKTPTGPEKPGGCNPLFHRPNCIDKPRTDLKGSGHIQDSLEDLTSGWVICAQLES